MEAARRLETLTFGETLTAGFRGITDAIQQLSEGLSAPSLSSKTARRERSMGRAAQWRIRRRWNLEAKRKARLGASGS